MKNVVLEVKKSAIELSTSTRLAPTPHLHKEIEIIYVKKGKAICYADNKFYEISDGDIFLCFPDQIHYYLNPEIGEYYVLIFSPNILYNIKNIFCKNYSENNVFRAKQNSEYSELIYKIFSENGDYKETVQVGLLNQLMPLFLSEAVLKPRIQTGSPTLQAILNYCTQNFTNDISLDSVANELHLNKYHISHLLNQKLNIGFNRYINTLRVYEACNLMEDRDKSLAYISEEAGFGSIRSFNRAFSEIMNTSPLQYYKTINPKKAQ